MSDRLASRLRVQALVRAAAANGFMAAVARRGEDESGLIWVRIDRFSAGVEVIAESYGAQGESIWRRKLAAGAAATEAAELIARETGFDADLWVVDIEDPQGRYAFPEPVSDTDEWGF